MKINKKLVLVCGIVFCVFAAVKAFAVPACPELNKIKQPDGREFMARAFGDEWYNGMETADGYTILQEPLSGFWVYAKKTSTGELYPSDLVVGYDSPGNIQKRLRDEVSLQMVSLRKFPKGYPEYIKGGEKKASTLPTLVILIEFKNQKLSTSLSSWKNLYFANKNSVKDFYEEVSYNQWAPSPCNETYNAPSDETSEDEGYVFLAKNDGIVKVKLSQKHPNTGGNTGNANRTVVKKALQAADKYVDFSKYDTNKNGHISSKELDVQTVCAGYEGSYGGSSAKTPNVWGHRWSLWGTVSAPKLDGVTVSNGNKGGGYTQIGERHAYTWDKSQTAKGAGRQATIGIIVHETGHSAHDFFDTYDTDGSSEGVGKWDLMAAGSWNKTKNSGDSPAHPNPYYKYFKGWTRPKVLKARQADALKNYKINQCETTNRSAFYLLGTNPNGAEIGGRGEYWIVENRQKTGYDAGLPGSGLCIWHIDESVQNNRSEWGTKNNHYAVALEQADGDLDLENNRNRGDTGDPFPGSSNNKKWNKSSDPDSSFWNGQKSKFEVSGISKSSKKMKAKIGKK